MIVLTPWTSSENTEPYDDAYPCGQAQVNEYHGRRIVNGENVPPHSHPWMVTVSSDKYESGSNHGSYGCGGTLISRKHVLSAFHCGKHCETPNKCYDVTKNWATIGDHDKRRKDGEIFVPITKPYHFHPKGKQLYPPRGAFMYDYVIFVLECCVTFNDYIQPACLAKQPQGNLVGKWVEVIGWGQDKYEGSNIPILQYIDIKVVSDDICRNIIKRARGISFNKEYLMCAGDSNGWNKDACDNDSGGIVIILSYLHLKRIL